MSLNEKSPLKKKLADWAAKNPDAILAPEILAKWEAITDITKDAIRPSQDDMGWAMFTSEDPVPGVLENILIGWGNSNPNYNTESTWQRIEAKLKESGFRAGDLIFHDCGCEALVFKIRGAEDMLLKISEFHEQKPNPYVLEPAAKALIPSLRQTSYGKAVSIALVPYLRSNNKGEAIVAEQIPNDPLASLKAPLADEITKRNLRFGLNELLNEMGLEFADPKPINSRCLPNYPNMPLVIDKRAVVNNGEPHQYAHPLDAETKNQLFHAYEELQGEIASHYAKKYGKGETCFAKVADLCREMRDSAPLQPRQR